MLSSGRIDIFVDVGGVVLKNLESEEFRKIAKMRKVLNAGQIE